MTRHNEREIGHWNFGGRIGHFLRNKRRFQNGILAACLIGVFAAISGPAHSAESRKDEAKSFEGAIGGQKILWQNWNKEQREKFWFTPQGSQIIPYDWATVLEMASSKKLFFGSENMNRLRFIPLTAISKDKSKTDCKEDNKKAEFCINPDKLPIGFTKDDVRYSDESIPGDGLKSLTVRYKKRGDPVYQKIAGKWLGMTCAACHTNQIEYGGKKIVIDGAPGMGDMEGLLQGIVEAMEATLSDERKFDRFAQKVLAGANGEAKSKKALKTHLAQMIEIRKAWNLRNSGGDLKYGFGRLDAINSILNEVSVAALGIATNRRPANAPVSYPFIWDAPHHDYIQWNGMVANNAAGALGRNVGEVLGVFGTLNFNPTAYPVDTAALVKRRANLGFPAPGYESSVRIPNLGILEDLLITLWSPAWPSTFPEVDDDLKKTGEGIFKSHCQGCHGTIDPESPARRITAISVPVGITGTDDAMARIFFERPAQLGALQGKYVGYFPSGVGTFDKPTDRAAKILSHAVSGTIAHDRVGAGTVVETATKKGFRTVKPGAKPKAASYKARALNGIWATAPYLHNGSVPTLAQLLKPSTREAVFYVGSRAFDPVEVGFKYKAEDYRTGEPKFRFDTSLKGNRNTGHAFYGTYFEENPDDFEALMAYLKKL